MLSGSYTLSQQALLRMNKKLSTEERLERVREVLEEVSLVLGILNNL